MADIAAANEYFETSVLYNDEWIAADDATKTRALNNASNVLSRVYSYKAIPDEAIYEQALWLLRIDDTMKRAEQGYSSIMVDGVQIILSQINRTIAPQVMAILGRKVGRTVSGRVGKIVQAANYDEYGNRIV